MFEYISFYPFIDILFIELPFISYPISTCDVSIDRDRWSGSIQLEFLSGKMDEFDTRVKVIVGWDYLLELLELW
jgi:hypothetical protein